MVNSTEQYAKEYQYVNQSHQWLRFEDLIVLNNLLHKIALMLFGALRVCFVFYLQFMYEKPHMKYADGCLETGQGSTTCIT